MGVIGPTTFAVLLWGTLLAVFGVFCYEAYAIGVEYGWIGGASTVGERSREGDSR
jgi:hypothetical protein